MARKVGSKTQNKPGGSPARRFTLTERQRLKNDAQQMDLRGATERQIAQQLGVSQATAHNLLAEIQQDYQDAYVDNRKAMVMRATAAHLDVIQQAQERIALVKERGKRKKVSKSGENAMGGYNEEVDTQEDGEIGGYLQIVTDNWKQIALLHGLHELPKQVFNVQVNHNTVNVFDQVLKAVLGTQDAQAIQDVKHPSPLALPTEIFNANGESGQESTASQGEGESREASPAV